MVPSPNFDARPAPPDMIVLHYTDMADVEAAIAWLSTPRSRVSAHYVVTAEGGLVQMVNETDRAWHAGVSSWEGAGDINARAIGIELDSPGHRPGAPHFPAAQIDALIDLMTA
ncbi:MAG: N-acetylmuramoyl-L-alanine amidase, partial [Pseudomonadota bacterium]